MHAHSSFDYAIIRVVPRVERGECINVGVILFCRTRRFLSALIELDVQRLLALAPDCNMALIEEHLVTIPRICAGGAEAGYIGQLSQSERFHWLVAPRSTILQTSPTHSGLCTDPMATLEHLMETMVRLPPPQPHEHSL
jgi:hypothetical protein